MRDLGSKCRRDDESLPALGEMDHRPVVLHARCVVRDDFRFELADRQMQADEIALAIDECGECFVGIAVFEVDRNLTPGEELAQRFDRESVRRMHAKHWLDHRERALDFRFDFGGKTVEQRSESRRDALIGPCEAFSQRRQFRPAAALARDERVAERAFAVAQESPGVPIGEARRAAGGREGAGLLDADQ